MLSVDFKVHIVQDSDSHKLKLFESAVKHKGDLVFRSSNQLKCFFEESFDQVVELSLGSEECWTVLKEAYDTASKSPVIFLNGGRGKSESLLISYDTDCLALQNKISLFNSDVEIGRTSYLFMGDMPMLSPRDYAFLTFAAKAPKKSQEYVIRMLASSGYGRIDFSAAKEDVIKKKFPIQAWKLILTNGLPSIGFISDNYLLTPLRLNLNKKSDVLFVFPERMLPLSRAYYVRAFDLFCSLYEKGLGVSVIIFGPGNADLDKIKSLLDIFSVNTHVYPLQRGGFTRIHRSKRKIESLYRKGFGVHTPAPMRFNERNMVFATKTNSQRLEESLALEKSIKSVIYTGAWFYPVIENVRKKFKDIKWYCDTHDVFHVVDEHSNKNEKRFLYSPKLQKKNEIDSLNKSDGLLAISPSDAASFKQAGVVTKLFKESGSFEQASFGVDVANGPKGLIFGFIGSGNNNNRNCLKLIANSWWPAILEKAPSAKLVIAGSACKTEESIGLEKAFKSSVNLLGFVDDLSGFYNDVQIMLSPIIVRGGLNFKSAEALVAGRVLLTNPMGAECLDGVDQGVVVINDDLSNIDSVMEIIMSSRNRRSRQIISQSAKKVFGQESAYSGFSKEFLSA